MTEQTNVKRNLGDLRPSQLMHSFGVGSIVELPHLSVMVMGLDDWQIGYCNEVTEARLLREVQNRLGPQVERLLTPPWTEEAANYTANPFEAGANVGLPVAPFPRWAVCPFCHVLAPLNCGLFELRPSRPYHKDENSYVHINCKKPGKPPEVVPARFLMACRAGHLDDFPWVEFVHRGKTDCSYSLELLEMGASGEVADIYVRCKTCEKGRGLVEAFTDRMEAEFLQCRGKHPHLREHDEDGCSFKCRPILLGASNSWFPSRVTVVAMPSEVTELAQLVGDAWATLGKAESSQNVSLLREVGKLPRLSRYSDEEIWAEVRRRAAEAQQAETPHSDVKEPEWMALTNPGQVRPTDDFRLAEVEPPPSYTDVFERVILAERLREVSALVGFTRLDPPGDPSDPDQLTQTEPVRLSRKTPRWVPAAETRGEGIFIQFSEEAVTRWLRQAEVLNEEFLAAHGRWRRTRGLDPDAAYPTARYVLLHSFSHALMRQLSLECGYPAASLRERVYSRPADEDEQPMAGVLIYTAASDSEGTLGGLVNMGRPENLEYSVDQALDAMLLCASDPLCAEHRADRGTVSLHGAACHACLFTSETSCERGNKYLDRTTLVPTVERTDLGFFERAVR